MIGRAKFNIAVEKIDDEHSEMATNLFELVLALVDFWCRVAAMPFVSSVNDNELAAHEYRLNVWFRDREESDRVLEDLEKRTTKNR